MPELYDETPENPADLPTDEASALRTPRLRRRNRSVDVRDRETLKAVIRDIPNFLKLLGRLAKDPRVSRMDKGIVVATLGYILMPMDLIPDFIPLLGQVDDVYLLALALDRLVSRAGIDILLDHWDGEERSLEIAISALDKAGALLPDRVRAMLHQRVR